MEIKNFEVGMLGTNCYVVREDGKQNCFIVDPGEYDRDLRQYIEKNGLVPSHILLTHGHGDHTGGIAPIREAFPDVKLVASRAERKLLYQRNLSFGSGGIVADIEVNDGDEMELCGQKLKFILTPGHTPGGMCILMGKVLFSGDTLFWGSVGRTDLPGGSFTELMASITEKLFVLPDDTRVLPGHMRETTIGFEKEFNPFVD